MIDEQTFKSLRRQAILNAMSIVGEHSSAEDIVQNSLLKLIKKQDQIQNIESWFNTVVRNEAFNFLKKNRRLVSVDSGLSGMSILNRQSILDFEREKYSYSGFGSQFKFRENKDSEIDLQKKAIQMLSKDERKLFRIWQKHPNSIKAIARKMSTNYNTVDKKLNIMRRNLKSNISRLKGLNVGKSVLQYRQYINITNMMKTFLTNLQLGDLSIMKHYGADAALKITKAVNIEKVIDWAIILAPKNIFKLYVFLKTIDYLNVIFIKFRINKKNFIKIQSYSLEKVKKLTKKAKEKVENSECIKGRLQVSFSEL